MTKEQLNHCEAIIFFKECSPFFPKSQEDHLKRLTAIYNNLHRYGASRHLLKKIQRELADDVSCGCSSLIRSFKCEKKYRFRLEKYLAHALATEVEPEIIDMEFEELYPIMGRVVDVRDFDHGFIGETLICPQWCDKVECCPFCGH